MMKKEAPFFPLLERLSPAAEEFWPSANRRVLWGWKRDVGPDSRTVFFAGHLTREEDVVGVTDQFLLYIHRTDKTVASTIAEELEGARDKIEPVLGKLQIALRGMRHGRALVEVEIGSAGLEELGLTEKLRRRRPRSSIANVPELASAPLSDLASLFPADLYVGSGVSYEAGIPTLCDMHDAFCVDDTTGTCFATGSVDDLPKRLATRPDRTVAEFCAVHTGALTARPTAAMRRIAELHKAGLIGEVYTDNVDNILSKTGVPFTRTRGSGVLNERCAVDLPSPRLIVVGVAADRRDVIAQARGRGREVVVVNPCERVAPHVRHLTYLRSSDRFYRTTADRFFGALGDVRGTDSAVALSG